MTKLFLHIICTKGLGNPTYVDFDIWAYFNANYSVTTLIHLSKNLNPKNCFTFLINLFFIVMKTYFYASFTWLLYSLTRLFIIFVNSFTCEYSSSCCCGSGKRGWWKEAAAAAVDCCWCCWHGPCCSSCCCCCRWWWDCWWGCWRWWWGRCTADSGAGKFSFLCWIGS